MFKRRNEIETPDYKALYLEANKRIHDLQYEVGTLRGELEAIKPVIETKKLKPAVSEYCGMCVYAQRSRWDGSIIGCCKDVVCSDFKRSDDDQA